MSAYHRATDGPRQGRFWVWARRVDKVWQRLVPLFALLALYIVLQGNADRRDQACKLFERQEQAAAQRVVGAYNYLRTLPQSDYGTNLTKTIVRNLPITEEEARATIAPDYCNEEGIGLPETTSDPKVPEHQDFSDRTRPHP